MSKAMRFPTGVILAPPTSRTICSVGFAGQVALQRRQRVTFSVSSGRRSAHLHQVNKERGLTNSIVDFEGMVLDGWNRYRCLLRLGVAIEQEELPAGANPRAFVKSRNLHRRRLNASQRALAVVTGNEWSSAGNPSNLAPGATLTNEQLAAGTDASPRTIRHAKVVAARATPEVVEALRAGEMSLTRVVETIKPMAPSQIPMSIQRLVPKDQLVLLAAHPCSGAVGASKGDLNTGTRNLTLDEATLLGGECHQAFPSMTGERNTQWSTQ